MASGHVSESQVKPRTGKSSPDIRIGLETDAIATALIENLHCLQGKLPQHATRNDWYMALAYTVRDRMMHRYMGTVESISQTNTNAKVVAYLSAEFLTGPHLGNGLINLGIWDAVGGHCRNSGKTCRACSSRRRSLGWATVA
jgi:glycogen phosphorylase